MPLIGCTSETILTQGLKYLLFIAAIVYNHTILGIHVRGAMRVSAWFGLAVWSCILVLGSTGFARSEGSGALIAELKKGGYVLFMRHTETEQNQADYAADWTKLDDCATQRHLSPRGRESAKAIGNSLRVLRIPLALVRTSQFCRARETAELMGFSAASSSLDLSEGGLVVSPAENKRRAEALKKELSTMPRDGANTLIIGHRPNLQDAAGKAYGDMAEGEIAVFKPDPEGGKFLPVGRILPEAWGQVGVE